jgi:hypothetical protein
MTRVQGSTGGIVSCDGLISIRGLFGGIRLRHYQGARKLD